MPKPLPEPVKDAHYVGVYATFQPAKELGKRICDWCDVETNVAMFSANDGIFVTICRDCERMARALSSFGFTMKRSYVAGIQKKRKEQLDAKAGESATATTGATSTTPDSTAT